MNFKSHCRSRRKEAHFDFHVAKQSLPTNACGSSKSGRGLPHFETYRMFVRFHTSRSVLECGSPLPLWYRTFVGVMLRRGARDLLTSAPATINKLAASHGTRCRS